jgi:hypothetical protein
MPSPLHVTPCTSTDPCMLHRPAPQIISRPVTSVTAAGLPSDCTSKITNQILTDPFTNRIFCVCLNRCDVCMWSFWGFGFQEISVSTTVVYFTDRRNVKLCCHLHILKGSMEISVVTQNVAVWYSGPLYVLQLTVSVLQTNSSVSSISLWRRQVTASSRFALRMSCNFQSCYCSFFPSDFGASLKFSLLTGYI